MGGEGAAAAAAAAPQSSASAASASGRDSHHQRLPRALCGRVQRGARKRRRRGGALRLSSSAAAAAAALEQRRQDAPEARERHRDALLPSQGRVLPGGDLGAEHQRRIGDGGEREGDESLEERRVFNFLLFGGGRVELRSTKKTEKRKSTRHSILYFLFFFLPRCRSRGCPPAPGTRLRSPKTPPRTRRRC